MDDTILQFLRDHSPTFLSGEEISRRLRVSRTAVWKRIRHLRDLGYEIEAATRAGYRLTASPDLLTPSEVLPLLKTKKMGRVIHHFHTLDSTNSRAYGLALDGAKEGEIVLAESQKKGRGRLERQWFSPPSRNLYLSVVLRPPIPPQEAPLLTLLAAVATADAIRALTDLSPRIKWPNDILLHDRKVAGLLNEIHSETDRVHFVILGIGVNVNGEVQGFPRQIRQIATTLREETGQNISRKAFLARLLWDLEAWYTLFLKEGGPPILAAWRERAQIRGRQVEVMSFGETLRGTAVDIDSDGALILDTGRGERRRVVAGDLSEAKASSGAKTGKRKSSGEATTRE